ncbi:hypothetical protein ACWDR3_15930 [Streptomyces sp. NPDC001002]
MELQLFDSNDAALFRIIRGEPLWSTFHRSLRDASLLPPHEAELSQDLEIQRVEVQNVLVILESALSDDLQQALAHGKGNASPKHMAMGAVALTVLGKRLSLDLRTDQDLALSRANDLTVALRDTVDSGRTVRVLTVPDWPRIARTLAWTLSREPGPLKEDDLREILLNTLKERAVRSRDPETVRDRTSDADLVRQNGLDDALSFLTSWRMVRETSPGEFCATDKLRLIQV